MKGEGFGEPEDLRVPRLCNISQNTAALLHPEKDISRYFLLTSCMINLKGFNLPKVSCRRKQKGQQTNHSFLPTIAMDFLVLKKP